MYNQWEVNVTNQPWLWLHDTAERRAYSELLLNGKELCPRGSVLRWFVLGGLYWRSL